MKKQIRHFLSLMDLSPQELRYILARAIEIKQAYKAGQVCHSLSGKVLAMLFEKSSTRTRVSAEIAMHQLGGYAVFLAANDSQIKRGETIEDSARVLGRMADALLVRTYAHERLLTFSRHSGITVINGLTDQHHPCQLLADMMTWQEKRGDIRGHTVAWVGDGNNMCNSYIDAALQFGFQLKLACPSSYAPASDKIEAHPGQIRLLTDPQEAVHAAHLVVTDTWINMGQEEESEQRRKQFAGYQVNSQLMSCAADNALFMHCLPARRGDEVSAEVLDCEQSVVWDEAENRLHSQKALLEFLLLDGGKP